MIEVSSGNVAFSGYHNNSSVCHVAVYREPRRPGRATASAVIATELPENAGTSITNRVEYLAWKVACMFALDPVAMTWVERLQPERPGQGHRFRLVSMQKVRVGKLVTGFAKPDWSCVEQWQVEQFVRRHLS